MNGIRIVAAVVIGGTVAAGGLWLSSTGLYVLLSPELSGEADRLAAALHLQEGRVVADVGAGRGRLSEALATRVGSAGRVYATELPGESYARLRARFPSSDGRVTVLEAAPHQAGLPSGCCDAIVLRTVFHHLDDPGGYAHSLFAALRPGGRLAVIDFAPGGFWHLRHRPDGADARRSGHGISREDVVEAVTAAGFDVEQVVERWSGPLFMVVFRRADGPR